jgi:hypothetical protein
MRSAFVLGVVLVLCGAPVLAQPVECSDGGISYDDGSFFEGAGWATFASRGEYVMRLDPPGGAAPLQTVCVCWFRGGADTQLSFNLRVWSADGPGGSPGTLLGTAPALSATGVSSSVAKFYRYDLASLGIIVPGPVYIGPEWTPNTDQGFFLCMDTDGPPRQPAYGGTASGPPRTALGQTGFFPTYRALGIRARFGEPVGGCAPSSTALCLADNRFKVEARYKTPQGQEGQAQVVKLTADTGYLWFFNSSNVETVVKVLDACTLNQKFWVFAGGLTNVEVTLTVTDTETDTVKTYTNPQGLAFQPVQDTGAFATCP